VVAKAHVKSAYDEKKNHDSGEYQVVHNLADLKLASQSSVRPRIAFCCTKIGRRLSSVLAETRIKRAPDKEDPNHDSYGKEWAHNS
jgi:hypothetical protein